MRKFFKLANFLLFVLVFWGVIALGSYAPARTILKQADLNPPRFDPAKLENPEESYAALERAIFGKFTPPGLFELTSKETLASDWLDGRAKVERRVYSVSHGQAPQLVEYVIVTPLKNPEAPLIISQNFSSNRSVISSGKTSPLGGKVSSMGPLDGVFRYFFGRYISRPPLEDILDKGYGFIAVHPPTYVADRAKDGTAQLNAMFGDVKDRPGALTVWASLTTALADELKTENPNRPIISYGHSRYGKTALLAAAHSPSIDAAIAHQSGTAGASLMRDNTGESLGEVLRAYPQWLTPMAAEYGDSPKRLPSDAHALLAVISPKPIFLGNARRDVWSDPEGAYQAARWAANNTTQTFSATRLDDFKPADDIAIWTRPGTHGVVKEDWPAFLAFLDAHFEVK